MLNIGSIKVVQALNEPLSRWRFYIFMTFWCPEHSTFGPAIYDPWNPAADTRKCQYYGEEQQNRQGG
jgi:hypothetical protein